MTEARQLSASSSVLGKDEEEDCLLARCLEGDGGAFGTLIDRYQRVLFNVSLRMVGNREDALDITQTVLLKAYENLGSFDRKRRFFSWVYRIAINESLNHLSRRRRQEPMDEALPSHESGPDDEWVRSRLHDSVQEALLKLTPDYRQVIVLRHFAELSYQEMGRVLEVPEKTVKSRLYTARQLLGEIFSKQGIHSAEGTHSI